MIYLVLRGRIGNQLFEYAMAESVRKGDLNETIVIDDSEVLQLNWENSLDKYNLKNVFFVHSRNEMNKYLNVLQVLLFKIYHRIIRKKSFWEKYSLEKKYRKIFNMCGVIACENGYLPYKIQNKKSVLLDGYFQSEKYFADYKNQIIDSLSNNVRLLVDNYIGIDKIRTKNSVCISIKVEHNVGSSMYEVCTKTYWEKAIKYICDNVDSPVFFVCSDNVKYVIDNLIDTSKYDYILQDSSSPVHVSLAAMAECKHFIIGNTTYGWWAQYLSPNKDKIVVAPSKWMLVDMPIDIYQDNWHLIQV